MLGTLDTLCVTADATLEAALDTLATVWGTATLSKREGDGLSLRSLLKPLLGV